MHIQSTESIEITSFLLVYNCEPPLIIANGFSLILLRFLIDLSRTDTIH